jgi:hypothetical protein
MTDREICDTYEKMVEADELTWVEVDHSKIPASTSLYCKMWLDYCGIKYKMATLQLGETYLFKVEDDFVKYLHHDPVHEKHMWADEGFHNYIDNNDALAKLSARSGVPEEIVKKMFDKIDELQNSPNN